MAKLKQYKVAHGDCNVPRGWAEDPRLSNWVNNQRVFKKKLDRGEPGGWMTEDRVARLMALGFIWQPRGSDDAGWEAQLAKLTVYKSEHGDCNVPASSLAAYRAYRVNKEDPRLSSWVSKRRLKRKLDRGEPSGGMTAHRAAKLDAIGLS
jgi:hypothetical protein